MYDSLVQFVFSLHTQILIRVTSKGSYVAVDEDKNIQGGWQKSEDTRSLVIDLWALANLVRCFSFNDVVAE